MDKFYRFHKEDKVVFLNKKAMRTFVKLNRRQKQMGLISGSILSVFAVMAIFNDQLAYESQVIAMQKSQQEQSRSIASVNSISNQAYQDAFQAKLLNDLKNEMKNDQVILGDAPSKKDVFLKGQFMGSYLLEDKGKNQIHLRYQAGDRYQMRNINSLVLSVLDTFYEGDFKEIKKVSQADTGAQFKVIADNGEETSLFIDYDAKRSIQSIEMK